MGPLYSLFSLILCFPSEEFISSDRGLFQTLDLPARRNILYHTHRAKAVLQLIIIGLGLRAEDSRVRDFRARMYCMYGIKFRVKNTVFYNNIRIFGSPRGWWSWYRGWGVRRKFNGSTDTSEYRHILYGTPIRHVASYHVNKGINARSYWHPS